MPLPNADKAIVSMEKLREYCLNASHERGGHKARVFSAMLGLTPANAEALAEARRAAVQSRDAVHKRTTEHGNYLPDRFRHGK